MKRYPENERGHGFLAGTLIAAGRTDDAIRKLTQARLLGATDSTTTLALAIAQLLKEDWRGGDETARGLLASADETARFFGAMVKYAASLSHGRSAEALTWADRATTAYKVNGTRISVGHQMTTVALLARGETARAAEAATTALGHGTGTPSEGPARILLAHALSAAGRRQEADAAVAALNVGPASPTRDRRDVALARGRAALARGEAAAAVPLLQEANAATPPRNGAVLTASPHLRIWTALGRALVESGKPADALPWFRKAADSGSEHVIEPVEFVRSFYYLGRIYEQQGDMTKARESYQRFVGYWNDGDLDRDRVTEARRKITGG